MLTSDFRSFKNPFFALSLVEKFLLAPRNPFDEPAEFPRLFFHAAALADSHFSSFRKFSTQFSSFFFELYCQILKFSRKTRSLETSGVQ